MEKMKKTINISYACLKKMARNQDSRNHTLPKSQKTVDQGHMSVSLIRLDTFPCSRVITKSFKKTMKEFYYKV